MSYVALCVGLVGTAAAAPVGDRVTSIPGISAADFPKFPIYSGCTHAPRPPSVRRREAVQRMTVLTTSSLLHSS